MGAWLSHLTWRARAGRAPRRSRLKQHLVGRRQPGPESRTWWPSTERPNRENRGGQGGPAATRGPLSRPWPLVAVTREEALTNRAACAVVGTRSQHPNKRARPSSDQTLDPNGEDTALKPRNSLYSKDKRNTTETPPPKVISYKPTHDRESTPKTQKRLIVRKPFTK
ncbi:hypothetical protein NDU88_006183 [Pleurodeles waltl]|uniref:Uncharacterized protein n=1 Tax=Pleurodeles waltl TaxID=8319 RepID=A0AAV7X0U4_PLEWA|nr:hypothetical protein NDU88_006183 [Pleurodeles waltl]